MVDTTAWNAGMPNAWAEPASAAITMTCQSWMVAVVEPLGSVALIGPFGGRIRRGLIRRSGGSGLVAIDRPQLVLQRFDRALGRRPLVALDDDPPEPGTLELGGESVRVADEQDRRPLEVEVVAGGLRDVIDRHGLDGLAVARQLVVREVVDDEARQRTHHSAGGL